MKLIEADEAFRVLSDYYHHRTETQADALREALDRVQEAVVYCADCKYCNVVTENEWLDARCTWYRDKSIRPPVELTHFCRRGERRSDER